MKSYVELEVWLETRRLVKNIYNISKQFPKDEIFGITSQIRRCAVSVPSNIAEGCGRRTAKETLQFLYISRGSIFELETQIYLVNDLNYITDEIFDQVLEQVIKCKRLLNGFINYFKGINDGNKEI